MTQPFDTSVEIITPENIAFRYHVAGPFRRLAAYLFDRVFLMLGIALVAIPLAMLFGIAGLGLMGVGFGLALWFVLTWFYGGLFETLWNGQTPGKRIMQIRVLCVDGQPIGGMQAVVRNLLRTVDAMPVVFYTFGLLTMFFNDRFQRLGDLACGTMVVVEEPRSLVGLAAVSEPDAIRLAAELPTELQISPSLAGALHAYVSRRHTLSWSRRYEIARLVAEPLGSLWSLPPAASPDLLLCALYRRAFVNDPLDEDLAAGEV